jgi:YHS domain-containing protein
VLPPPIDTTERRPDVAETREIAPNEDPVCGMTVEIEAARAKGLAREHDGREYVFCGKGCFLEFGDDPETFLAAGYTPSM